MYLNPLKIIAMSFEDDMIERVYTTNSICTLDCREYPRIKFIDCENGAEFI